MRVLETVNQRVSCRYLQLNSTRPTMHTCLAVITLAPPHILTVLTAAPKTTWDVLPVARMQSPFHTLDSNGAAHSSEPCIRMLSKVPLHSSSSLGR